MCVHCQQQSVFVECRVGCPIGDILVVLESVAIGEIPAAQVHLFNLMIPTDKPLAILEFEGYRQDGTGGVTAETRYIATTPIGLGVIYAAITRQLEAWPTDIQGEFWAQVGSLLSTTAPAEAQEPDDTAPDKDNADTMEAVGEAPSTYVEEERA